MTETTFRESPLSLAFWLKFGFTGGMYFFWWRANVLIVTDKHVIRRQGVFGKTERSIPISHILDVGVKTSLLGRIFGYGDLQLQTGAYGGHSAAEVELRRFSRPRAIKDTIARYQSQ